MNSTIPCPLCKKGETSPFFKDKNRSYNRCYNCDMIFVQPNFRLSKEKEKKRYDLHENSPEDKNYRNFLSRLCSPLLDLIPTGSTGLDFGSGPAPTLSLMLKEAGHKMNIYDCYYANDISVFNCQYDFITASEVIEHLFYPLSDLNKLWICLKPNGYLGIMTKLIPQSVKFESWYYKNDPTHICFYSRDTFEWIGEKWNSKPVFINNDVIIFRKNADCKKHIN